MHLCKKGQTGAQRIHLVASSQVFPKKVNLERQHFNQGRRHMVVPCIFPHNQVRTQPRIDLQFRSQYT